jgi:hypothetical protein
VGGIAATVESIPFVPQSAFVCRWGTGVAALIDDFQWLLSGPYESSITSSIGAVWCGAVR